MKRVTILFFLTIIVGISFIVVMLIWQGRFGLRRPPEVIRADLLKDAPLGMSFDQVQQFLASSGIVVIYVSKDKGLLRQDINPPILIGVQGIETKLGHYYFGGDFFLPTNVYAYFAFDQDKRLIEIWVEKVTDSW